MFRELLRQKLAGIVELTQAQLELLEAHYNLLLRWNRSINLTTVSSVEEAVERHYAESVFLAKHLPERPLRIVDIGSGGGFPGIPVAVFRPDCSLTLVESHKRKSVFLREATRNLFNVRIHGVRAEDISESFDFAISRAVSYQDLRLVLKKVAHSAELLTGGEGPSAELGFRWEEPIALPWGSNRFLRVGVSRET